MGVGAVASVLYLAGAQLVDLECNGPAGLTVLRRALGPGVGLPWRRGGKGALEEVGAEWGGKRRELGRAARRVVYPKHRRAAVQFVPSHLRLPSGGT